MENWSEQAAGMGGVYVGGGWAGGWEIFVFFGGGGLRFSGGAARFGALDSRGMDGWDWFWWEARGLWGFDPWAWFRAF